jgi:5-methylcytosine-specific restriction endonuclease McrA
MLSVCILVVAFADPLRRLYNAYMRHLAIYGSVRLVRDMCPDCKRHAFVIDGVFACCDLEAGSQTPPEKIKRMISGENCRVRPPLSLRRAVLESQYGKCFYCFRLLGGWIPYLGKAVQLRLNWDHLVPYSYLNGNPLANFVAACHICNRYKSSLMFQTVEEARVYIATRIETKNRVYESRLPKGSGTQALQSDILHA